MQYGGSKIIGNGNSLKFSAVALWWYFKGQNISPSTNSAQIPHDVSSIFFAIAVQLEQPGVCLGVRQNRLLPAMFWSKTLWSIRSGIFIPVFDRWWMYDRMNDWLNGRMNHEWVDKWMETRRNNEKASEWISECITEWFIFFNEKRQQKQNKKKDEYLDE